MVMVGLAGRCKEQARASRAWGQGQARTPRHVKEQSRASRASLVMQAGPAARRRASRASHSPIQAGPACLLLPQAGSCLGRASRSRRSPVTAARRSCTDLDRLYIRLCEGDEGGERHGGHGLTLIGCVRAWSASEKLAVCAVGRVRGGPGRPQRSLQFVR